LGCILAMAVLLMVFLKTRSETLSFTVVDAVTGATITNALVFTGQRWTDLPVEKLRIGLRPFRRFPVESTNGTIKVLSVPKQSRFMFSIAFIAQGYHLCTFQRSTKDELLYGSEGERVRLPKTNQFTITLRPKRFWKRYTFDEQGRAIDSQWVTNASVPRELHGNPQKE
jgi:hypothetical protein